MIPRVCQFSPDRKYRYTLWRTIAPINSGDLFGGGKLAERKPGFVQFICLNPSTADETTNDNTVTRCINFCDTWGYGEMCMTNLFAFRATDPSVMKAAPDPVGPDNMLWLERVCKDAALIVAAWGVYGDFNFQARIFLKAAIDWDLRMHCLKFTKSGHPQHPLYVAADIVPVPFNFTR